MNKDLHTIFTLSDPVITSEISPKTQVVSGHAEPDSVINFYYTTTNPYEAGGGIGRSFVDSNGNFAIILDNPGRFTYYFQATKNGIKSGETKVISADYVPPLKPVILSTTSDFTTSIKGIAEAGSTIEVKKESKLIGTGTANLNSSSLRDGYYYCEFDIPIELQRAGTELDITATDSEGNISEIAKVVVVDQTPPSPPKVNKVTDQSVLLSGVAEPFSTISVNVEMSSQGYGIADSNGAFEVKIPQQKAGTKLLVVSTDLSRNDSEETKVIVEDATAPLAPKVNEVTDRMTTVIGMTEAKAIVTVKVGGEVIGTTEADPTGAYEVTILRQEGGTKLSVVATDAAKNNSEATETIVKDVTAPPAPKVNEVTDRTTTVSGTTEAKVVVTVKVGEKVLGTTEANELGSYEMTIPLQPGGTKLSVVATDAAKNSSEATETIVKDVTAPLAPKVNEVTDRMTTVSGTTEAKAVVTVKVGEKVIGTTEANPTGVYEVTIPRQEGGTKLSVVATDAAKNNSGVTETIVKDVTAPLAPKVNGVTDRMTTVSGMTEAKAIVTVKVGGEVIGTTEADPTGAYEVTILRQEGGTKLSVVATDAAKNNSEATETIVKDVTAPPAPKVNEVTDRTTTVSGMTEAKAVVTVKVGEKVIGTTEANATGVYEVTIPKQTAGTTLTITAMDASGNLSSAVTVLVADRTAPPLQVNQVTNRSVLITGTTEAKAKVQLIYATKTMETTADSNGKFSFSIELPKTGVEFIFTVSDASGNESDVLTLKALDAMLPILKGVTDTTIEAGTLFNPKVKVTAADETDGDLTKSISISGKVDNKKPGLYRLAYSVKDKAGNETKQIRNVTVKDTIKPVISGAKDQSINLNSSFNAKNDVTAKDNIDGVITKNIKISGTVNVKKIGVYVLTYKVSDASGNTVTTLRKIIVKDNVKPIISGAKSKTIKYKSSFNPKTGITAKDNVDGVLTKSIKVTGSVNTKRKGTYALTYSVKDKARNGTSVKIKIMVK
ncbi:Ig-like domain-containing protein [Exiguobacterium sp.]|nr:Ig-like domain-containing protein [Exiguobacterium sp.]